MPFLLAQIGALAAALTWCPAIASTQEILVSEETILGGKLPDDSASTPPKTLKTAASQPSNWPTDAPRRTWTTIVLHHSGTLTGDIEAIDAAHRRRRDSKGKPWLGIGYHFVVGNGQGMADGQIQATFRWRQQLDGAHAGTHQQNQSGIGICLIGDYNRHRPSERQLAAVKQLVSSLATECQIPRGDIVRHADLRATDCPGKNFPLKDVLAVVDETSRKTNKPSAKIRKAATEMTVPVITLPFNP